jgi:hypothetical protein
MSILKLVCIGACATGSVLSYKMLLILICLPVCLTCKLAIAFDIIDFQT